MVEITILTTILAKFDDGSKKLVHLDPIEGQIYSQENLTEEQSASIKKAFAESYNNPMPDDNQPDLDVDYKEMLKPYTDQNWEEETEIQQEPIT